MFPPSEADADNFVDVCHAITTLKNKPDPILAPMIDAAKADTDYQLIIQALNKIKNPKSLPSNHPGCQLKSIWSELSVDESLGLIILNGTRIFFP